MKLHTLPIGSQYGEDKNQEYKDHDDLCYDEEKDHDEDKEHNEGKDHVEYKDHGELRFTANG